MDIRRVDIAAQIIYSLTIQNKQMALYNNDKLLYIQEGSDIDAWHIQKSFLGAI